MDDLFSAEAAILERLRARIPAFRLVQGARDLKGIGIRTGATPALYLVQDGLAPLTHAGAEQALEQQWLTVVAVANLRGAGGGGAGDGRGERSEAGPLLFQVCQALIGWQPGAGHGPLRVIASPGALFSEGQALFPLRFATRIVATGAG